MTRMRGWAPKGERLIAKAPFGKWQTLTFLAALRHDRIDAPVLFDGPIKGLKFRTYVEEALVPTLKPGDIVIIDNLGSHKGYAVRAAIRKAGARLFFLPHTPRTSIQSRWSSPSSKPCYAKRPHEPSQTSFKPSPKSSTVSPKPNAQTTFATPDMRHADNNGV
jgi:DDE superfamily endonuclease